MKNNFLGFIGSLFLTLGFAWLVVNWLAESYQSGYAIIGFGHWSMEASLTVWAVTLITSFFILYFVFRALGILIRMPGKMKKRRHNVRFNRSQEALIAGLLDAADGNWERAEKVLIKHATSSGAPLLHYLTAARAAQSRGALDKRDEYLRKAQEQSSEGNLVVGLTQAELHLSEQQFHQALETLTQLHSINPGHARVLRMLHQTYQQIGDWEGLSKILPSLRENKVLLEAEVKLLETETYSRTLKLAAQEDAQALRDCWDTVPEHIRVMPGIANIYFAAMIRAGASTEIESAVLKQLARHWDDTLLVLFANIDSVDPGRHLQTVEQWLAVYPSSAVLQRVLGKLALDAEQMEKAEQYLLKSLNLDPSVEAYQLLGHVMHSKDEKDKACEYYQKGLELASGELVRNIEAISA